MFGDGLEEPLKNFPVVHTATDPDTKAEMIERGTPAAANTMLALSDTTVKDAEEVWTRDGPGISAVGADNPIIQLIVGFPEEDRYAAKSEVTWRLLQALSVHNARLLTWSKLVAHNRWDRASRFPTSQLKS
ncbi:hypothetical protein MMC29_006778 [Sticta canariensis]|nr:hypothetical protein [Sticta canariensis]